MSFVRRRGVSFLYGQLSPCRAGLALFDAFRPFRFFRLKRSAMVAAAVGGLPARVEQRHAAVRVPLMAKVCATWQLGGLPLPQTTRNP